MGRPRKTTAHLELVGAFRKNPQRARDSEPKCEEEAVLPPISLNDDEMLFWDFLLDCAVPGVITKMDSLHLAMCCKAAAQVWTGREELDKEGNVFIKAATITEIRAASAMLGQLGMTPSDRSKVSIPKKPNGNGFKKLNG